MQKRTLHRVAENLYRAHETGVYYARFSHQGKPIQRSLKVTRRDLAASKLKDLMGSYERVDLDLANATFAQVLSAFESSVVAAKDIKDTSREDRAYRTKALLRDWPVGDLAATPIREVRRTDCERWMAARRTQVGPQRLKNERNLLREIFRFAIREGYLLQDPTDQLPSVRVPNSTVTPPTRAELKRLVEHLYARGNERAAEMVELLAYSGLRRSEAAGLHWRDFDFARGRARVAGKGRAPQEGDEIPLFPALRELLERIRARRDRPQPADRILLIHDCRGSLANAARALQLPRFTHHSLRHYFCSEMIVAGVDFKTIAAWLRHKDGGILVAKTYGHLRRDHSDQLAATINLSVAPPDVS